MGSEMKYAVLIDGDNIAPKYLKCILEEVADLGVATYKRIYSDWTERNRDSWKQTILEHSVLPVQQYSYTTGKNATDSAMIIDAMDILYTGNVDGFCLVTSDSDFTRLAARLREAGKYVIGFGEAKTPQAFRNACNSFKLLEIIYTEEEPTKGTKKSKVTEKKGKAQEKKNAKAATTILDENTLMVADLREIKKSIYKIIDENSNKGKETFIGEIGSKLVNKYPDFDVRNYGCTKLSTLLEDKLNSFRLIPKNNSTVVMIKREDIPKEEVKKQVITILEQHGGYCNNMATVNESLKVWNENFSAKKYGYSKFANFLQSFSDVVEIKGNEVHLLGQKETDE